MTDRDRARLDDLTENQSILVIDCGDTLVKGTYQGLHRYSSGEWALKIKPQKQEMTLVATKDVVTFRKVII